MGIHAKWTTTCDQCGKQEVAEFTPETEPDDCNDMDIWSPGFPPDWFHLCDESVYGMFCSIDCMEAMKAMKAKAED